MDGNLNQSKENAGGNQDFAEKNVYWQERAFDKDEVLNSQIFMEQIKMLDDPRLKDN